METNTKDQIIINKNQITHIYVYPKELDKCAEWRVKYYKWFKNIGPCYVHNYDKLGTHKLSNYDLAKRIEDPHEKKLYMKPHIEIHYGQTWERVDFLTIEEMESFIRNQFSELSTLRIDYK